MNTLKRISASISAQINSMVDQIENHEAVANMALHDIREALMQAKFQIRRVQNEQASFEQRLKEMRKEEERWTERALHSQNENHERAIECVRRLKKTRDEIATLGQQLTEHGNLERQLTEDVRRIENKFEDLKRKRNLLVARESRSQALSAVADHENSIQLGSVFERWEKKVLRNEVEGESILEPADSFASEYNTQEERLGLEALLEELNKSKTETKNS
ncbi:MAG: PspA/IM30 family protein [Pseudobdellovibrionaceae bacterium]